MVGYVKRFCTPIEFLASFLGTTRGTIHFSLQRIDLSHGSQTIMDLQGTVRVDGKTYLWTGQTETTIEAFSANLSAVRITPTRTIFVLQAGPINVTITYLSPIEVRHPALNHTSHYISSSFTSHPTGYCSPSRSPMCTSRQPRSTAALTRSKFIQSSPEVCCRSYI